MLPFGPLGIYRTPAQYALLNAGVADLAPDDAALIWDAAGTWPLRTPHSPSEAKSIRRSCRTLATRERHFTPGTHFVAIEPNDEELPNRTCGWVACAQDFSPHNASQKFCSGEHQKAAASLKREGRRKGWGGQ
jgi:hypothetical protein